MLGQPFNVEVEGVGTFTFRDRTFRDQVRIEAMASEILGRTPNSLRPDEQGLGRIAVALAMVTTLGTEFPAGFNPDALDPLSPDDAETLMTVHGRLVEQLARFRAERAASGTQKRAGA